MYLTDRSDATETRRNVDANIELNGLGGVAEFMALNWGDMNVPANVARVFEAVDMIFAADCFYQSEGEFKRDLVSALSSIVFES